MLAGDPAQRSRTGTKMKRQICYRCYTGPNFGGDTGAPCQDDKFVHTARCLTFTPLTTKIGSIAKHSPLSHAQAVFAPISISQRKFSIELTHYLHGNNVTLSCWDGVNLDSPNHQDHVAYPTSGPANFLSLGGNCPSTHPVRIPQLMYEVVWDTTAFNNKADWPATGQPFVLSQGDETGYGQHADYVFGWQGNSLQKAMDATNCMGAQCKDLKTQTIDKAKACQVKKVVQEDQDGCELL